MSEPLVIIGNGMAAAKLAEELSRVALGRYAIAVVGEEPRLAYNRVLLSSVLAGAANARDIELHPAHWWRDRGVTLRYGCKAMAVDMTAREVRLADGKRIAFSKLVFATGSHATRLPLAGANLDGVHVFRDCADVDALSELARTKKKVAVIGGGLLGLEAAYGLARGGADVTLIHVMDRLMERQLDAPGAALLKELVEAKNIRVLLNANTGEILGEKRVQSLLLADGRRLDADAVIFAVGVRPNIDLARAAGVSTERGIIVDDDLATNIAGVYALGECAQHRGVCYGLVEPAYEQARALAAVLAGRDGRYAGSLVATNLKVSGVGVFSAGDFLGGPSAEIISYSDPRAGIYRKLVIEADRLVGAELVGDTSFALDYLALMRAGADISNRRDALMFSADAPIQKAA
ncbi:FAD-dependent oxidoreductase [Methylocystis sp. 9N]|uniref:FAD-dependent oxidoreductase n=1 Tax=Methylocystis borbori TaxID=3118750 RepID=A0ABU7XH73_9HYPH